MTYKMKLKRILSSVLVFILIISLCACSTKKKKNENRLNLLTAETQENHYLPSENEEADRDEDYDIFENDFSLGLDEFNIEAKNIEDVKYLRTEKGIDYLTVSVRSVENGNKKTNLCFYE